MIKKIMTLVLAALIGLSGAACGDGENPPDSQKPAQGIQQNMTKITLTAGGESFSTVLYDNETARKLTEKLPMTLDMSELNGNEKYYHFRDSLPTDSKAVGKIMAGDLMVYGDNSLVLFYESFNTSYSYTKIGYIEDVTGLQKALGKGEVTVDFSLIETETTPSDQKSDGKILIAYYSRTGNTKELAEMIQGETSGDLFEIKTEAAYPDSYDEMLDIATKEQSENARPALSSAVENMKDYDVIFIGYPIWWGDTPMAVRTFLESYDFSGKKVVPFCTYGSSGFGNSLKSVKASAAKAEVLDGFGTAGSQVGGKQAELGEWIKGLKI